MLKSAGCGKVLFIMVKMIENMEIISSREAMEKYEAYYIGFVTTNQNFSDPDNEMGYVVFIMDTYDEGFAVPRKTDNDQFIAIMPGYAVGGTEIGGVYFDA